MISVFLIGLALLIALALAFVLPTLLRRSDAVPASTAPDAARQANLRVLREQLRALDAEHASGALDAAQYQSARTEIEQRALQEDSGAERVQAPGSRAGRTALVLGLFVPFFALALYGVLGTPQAVLPQAGGMAGGNEAQQPEFTQAQVEDMVARLAQRLESKTTSEASDVEGWVMLARSYGVLQRYPEAAKAYARARALAPNDAQLLADYADVLAMAQGQRVSGEPQQLVEQALRFDPRNLKALALAGSAAFERKDYATALRYWNEALAVAPPGSEFAQGLQGGIRDAQQAMAGGASPAAAAAPSVAASAPPATAAPATTAAASAPAAPAAAGAAQGGITGTVQLSPALAAKVAPTDTVFIFARAEQGSRMPLAILKRSASELPLKFQLDDSSAMAPELKLSGATRVVVGARISRSGDAMPRSGDLSGQAGPMAPGAAGVVVTIDGVQP